MLESLDINGKTYVPYTRAAEIVGFSPSYVLRLAQGKWIDSAVIQDVCLVCIDSLRAFVETDVTEAAERTRQALNRERAVLILKEYEANQSATREAHDPWVIIGQAGVVTFCGLMLGLLGLRATEAGLSWQLMGSGALEAAAILREQVVLPTTTYWRQTAQTLPAVLGLEPKEATTIEPSLTTQTEFAPEVELRSQPDGSVKIEYR